jgi:predicted nuclease of predicted toxin-antitoxin system
MDVHIPAAITAGLRRRNIDVLISQEDGTREVDDVLLLQRATALGRVLFSQDQDLLHIATEWQRTE